MSDKISANEFHESIDRHLSDMKADPWLAQRIIASEKGEVKVKKLSGAVLVVSVIFVLSMATALAAGFSGLWKTVNWFGEVVEEEEAFPSTTSTPSISMKPVTEPVDIDAIMREVLNKRAAREHVVVAFKDGIHYAAMSQNVGSMEEFTLLMSEAPDFPLPQSIPDGYTFTTGHIEYGCLSDGDYILTSQEAIAEGITVSHYVVDESKQCILGYSLSFSGANQDDNISISARVMPLHDPHDDIIGVAEDQTSQAMEIEGMENGLGIDSDVIHYLFMRKLMRESFSALIFGSQANWVETYGEYHIRLSAANITAFDLTKVFAE